MRAALAVRKSLQVSDIGGRNRIQDIDFRQKPLKIPKSR